MGTTLAQEAISLRRFANAARNQTGTIDLRRTRKNENLAQVTMATTHTHKKVATTCDRESCLEKQWWRCPLPHFLVLAYANWREKERLRKREEGHTTRRKKRQRE